MYIDPHQSVRHSSVRDGYRTRPAPTATEALLDLIGPVDDTHVLLIGPGGLDMMCNLIDAGCASVEMAGLGQRHRGDFAEIVIVPGIDSLGTAQAAIVQARRMMRPLNSLILRFTMADPAMVVQAARGMLAAHGFSGIHAYHLGDGPVLTAELPLCGPVCGLAAGL